MRKCVRAATVAALSLSAAAPLAAVRAAPSAPTPSVSRDPQSGGAAPRENAAAPQAESLPAIQFCGQQAAPPRAQPPAGSPPIVLAFGPCFEAQGGTSVIEPQTYLYYIQLKQSRPSEGVWVPYDDASEKTIEEDFHRLWNTNFLDNLFIEANDYKFPNGTVGKVVTYNMEERQRVKIVDYVGSKAVETSKIDEKLKEANAQIRLDTFIDPGLIRKVSGIVRDMLREKGFQFAEVTPDIKEIPGGPKLVHVTFNMDEGPKVKIRRIDFVGNKAMSDGTLKHQLKDNTERGSFQDFIHFPSWFMSLIGDHGTFQEQKFDDDAEKVVAYYRDHGYLRANVGVPELKTLQDAGDKKTRWIELKIPVTEGPRYKVGSFDVAGNTVVKSEFLKPLFKMNTGEFYGEKRIRKGLEKAREIYGQGGYMDFTGFPDYKFHDDPNPNVPEAPESLRAPAPTDGKAKEGAAPLVDVTMRIQEGERFFVNRITFVGNTTTRDNVIRRELRLVEDAPFNTEALKYSVKRLNQLGYFKALEGGKDVDVQKVPNTAPPKVDVKLKLEEQNRNQLTFGAGVSEFEGFFGQLSFQTANFLGRGESLTLAMSAGSRAQNYSLAFQEPFLFDRNITGGFNVFRQDVRYIGQFTQRSTGAVLTFGFPLSGFSRMFTNYSYERVRVTEIADVYQDPVVLARNPFLRDSLLIGQSGERIISKVVPSYVYNTVDQPIFPTSGKRVTASIDLAGVGGNTNFYKPLLEGVWYIRQGGRLTLGMRGQTQYIHSFKGSQELPIFEKLFLGGEYSIRGFDIRTIGPQDPVNGLVLGGNKSLLFNLEEQITIAGPVRLIAFYDAGQVQPGPTLVGPAAYVPAGGSLATLVKPGQSFNMQDWKTSTGLEVRFFMPVLNVPFRLIFAYNPQRSGVLDNTLQPQKAFQFRFAVGSTF
ncbi:MAG TPA: BamA/TamA family outer membrane protein [Vicinamibacterales bacterium]|nr:BamA/TamA family outer membrane protein [Vicinamibacterales bacterium]